MKGSRELGNSGALKHEVGAAEKNTITKRLSRLMNESLFQELKLVLTDLYSSTTLVLRQINICLGI